MLHCAPPPLGWLQRPNLLLPLMVHTEPQQSLGLVQMSPFWPQ